MPKQGSLQYIVSCRAADIGETITQLDESACVVPGTTPMKLQTIRAHMVTHPAEGGVNNYNDAAVLWTTGFSSVVGLYLLAAHVGAVIGFIRRA